MAWILNERTNERTKSSGRERPDRITTGWHAGCWQSTLLAASTCGAVLLSASAYATPALAPVSELEGAELLSTGELPELRLVLNAEEVWQIEFKSQLMLWTDGDAVMVSEEEQVTYVTDYDDLRH